MKWVLIARGVIVGLILLIGLVGMLIPKSHVASRKARFNQTPQTVWDAITDFQGQTSWRTSLTKVERLPDRDGNAV